MTYLLSNAGFGGFSHSVDGVFLCVKGFACFPLCALCLWSCVSGVCFFPSHWSRYTDVCSEIKPEAAEICKKWWFVDGGRGRISRGEEGLEKTTLVFLCPLEPRHQMVGWFWSCASKRRIDSPQRGTLSTITRLSIVKVKWKVLFPRDTSARWEMAHPLWQNDYWQESNFHFYSIDFSKLSNSLTVWN